MLDARIKDGSLRSYPAPPAGGRDGGRNGPSARGHTSDMRPPWIRTVASHLRAELQLSLTVESARYLRPDPPDAGSASGGAPRASRRNAAFAILLATVFIAGPWSIVMRLGAPLWWIATGRGPGGRLLATQPTWPPRTVHLSASRGPSSAAPCGSPPARP